MQKCPKSNRCIYGEKCPQDNIPSAEYLCFRSKKRDYLKKYFHDNYCPLEQQQELRSKKSK